MELTIDPQRMTPKPLAPVASDQNGKFEVAVHEPGAGFLSYDVAVLCRLTGYRSLTQNMPLPPGNKRLLVIMVPGHESYQPATDILHETLKLKEQLDR